MGLTTVDLLGIHCGSKVDDELFVEFKNKFRMTSNKGMLRRCGLKTSMYYPPASDCMQLKVGDA